MKTSYLSKKKGYVPQSIEIGYLQCACRDTPDKNLEDLLLSMGVSSCDAGVFDALRAVAKCMYDNRHVSFALGISLAYLIGSVA